MVSRLQEENRKLLKDYNPNHTPTQLTPTTDSDMLQKLKDSVEKQRDELRLKEKLLEEKTNDIDTVSKLNLLLISAVSIRFFTFFEKHIYKNQTRKTNALGF